MMNRSILVTILVSFILAPGAIAQQRRVTRKTAPKPSPAPTKDNPPPKPEIIDSISGEWNGIETYRDLKIPFKLNLKLDAGSVSGEIIDSHDKKRITAGSWSDGQLVLTIENPREPNRPSQMTASRTKDGLVGRFGGSGEATWQAERFTDQLRRATTNQPPDVASKVKTEFEKLFSLNLSLQMEGAYNFGEMGAKGASAVPFLLAILPLSGGVKEVDQSSLRFLGETTVGLASTGKVYTVYPVQNVTARALAKIGEPAIEPIRLLLSKEPPEAISASFALDALARMQNPTATKILHDMARSGNVQLKRKVIDSLAENNSPATVELLIEFLNDPEAVIRTEASASLKRTTGKDFGQDFARWKEWWSLNKPKP